MNPDHHPSKPVLIGEIQEDGQFETVWETEDVVVGDASSDYIPESAKLTRTGPTPGSAATARRPSSIPS